MKVLLIFTKINSNSQWHVGFSYISAVLKENGHSVELMEMENYDRDIRNLLYKIEKYEPGVIGITANTHQFPYAKKIARDIKEKFNFLIFIGGVHTTLKPESIKEEKAIDGVCIGEGELSFLKLVNRIQEKKPYFDIENFWFRDGEQIIKNAPGSLLQDLDSLPIPDRAIFKYFSQEGERAPRFIFSRGCPFECTYCCNHAFKKIYKGLGTFMRWRSVDMAIEEIKKAKQKYNFRHFKLDDDTFSLNKVWMNEFCEKAAAQNWSLTFECNVRPGTIDEEGIRSLKKAGCVMIKVGVESGNPELRKKILGRNFSNEDIIKVFDISKKIGVKTFSFNMIGVPGETPETIKETINLNRRIMPDKMQATVFYPYAGTVLGDRCLKEGYIKKNHEDSYMEKSILELPTVSKRKVEKAVKNFKFNVYWKYDKKKAFIEKYIQIKKSFSRHPIAGKLVKIIRRKAKAVLTKIK